MVKLGALEFTDTVTIAKAVQALLVPITVYEVFEVGATAMLLPFDPLLQLKVFSDAELAVNVTLFPLQMDGVKLNAPVDVMDTEHLAVIITAPSPARLKPEVLVWFAPPLKEPPPPPSG